MNLKSNSWLPSFADLFFLCPFLILTLDRGHYLLNDGDTGWHIRAGEYIIENLTVPRYDIFSHISPPLPWFAHEWLSEVTMALVHRLSGLTGLVIFFSLLIAVLCSWLFRISCSHNRNLIVVVLLVLLATVSSSLHWLARPHIFSLVLTVFWYGILEQYQYGNKNRLYLLPPLMLLWANLHGGFILGFLLLAVYFTGNLTSCLFAREAKRDIAKQKCKKLALFAVACLLSALLNPRGYSLLLFPLETVSNQWLMDHVVEFLSPNFHQGLPYTYLLLLAMAVIALSRTPLNTIEIILVLLVTYMSLYSARYIPVFAIIVTPILLRQIDGILERLDNPVKTFLQARNENLQLIDERARPHFWPAIAVLLVCVLAVNGQIEFKFDENKKPVAAVEFLKKERIPGKMFNDDEFGDYLIYAAWPQYKVFFDGRSDMYGEKWGSQYLAVVNLRPNWKEVIDKNDFSWIFVGARSPLSTVLLETKDWRSVYADGVAHIFVRRIAESDPLIDK